MMDVSNALPVEVAVAVVIVVAVATVATEVDAPAVVPVVEAEELVPAVPMLPPHSTLTTRQPSHRFLDLPSTHVEQSVTPVRRYSAVKY